MSCDKKTMKYDLDITERSLSCLKKTHILAFYEKAHFVQVKWRKWRKFIDICDWNLYDIGIKTTWEMFEILNLLIIIIISIQSHVFNMQTLENYAI